MYSYLKGILSEKNADIVVIDCSGIGFELRIPLSTYDMLPDLYQDIKLYVYTYHNDEGTKLFGFFTKQEKELFKLLININRIGPKLALAILSTISLRDLISAIITNNTILVSKTPGLGKKSAERLIIELKDKIEFISELDTEQHFSDVTNSHKISSNNTVMSEVETALSSLGFKNFEIRKAMQSIKITDSALTQDIVKDCIKFIYLKRNEI